MDGAKNQLAERLKSANNVLVTVSRNPSVDQLSACLGLTLALNKMGKHAAAVFSGEVPSTLEFLQPEETIEKNTDSLRDFIIALDKSKADKLRYKVEDDVVRIFITPYRSSISEKDLTFSEGDFNVDVVVALGVHQQEDLDGAITIHGRILHDATVASVNNTVDGGLGSINWHDNQASSLSELITELVQALDPNLLDNQIANALLTGIVAETDRFSNDKTSSLTMSASAALMSAGANQQLVASKLQEEAEPKPVPTDTQAGPQAQEDTEKSKNTADGMLEIEHADGPNSDQKVELGGDAPSSPEPNSAPQPSQQPGEPKPEAPEPPASGQESQPGEAPGSKLITEPPALGGTLTANSRPEALDPTTDPMSVPASEAPQLLNRAPATPSTSAFSPPPTNWTPPNPQIPADGTLSDLEAAVKSPHLGAPDTPSNPANPQDSLAAARDEINSAIGDGPVENNPIQALNAQPMGDNIHQPTPQQTNQPQPPQPAPPPADGQQQPAPNDPNAPPPVPPPIPFQFNDQNNNQQNQQ